MSANNTDSPTPDQQPESAAQRAARVAEEILASRKASKQIAELLPDDLQPETIKAAVREGNERRAVEKKAQKKARKAAAKRKMAAARRAQRTELDKAQTPAQQRAVRLAQIVNLHIAGYSFAQIGEAIGATPEEIDRTLRDDVGRYVRSQPALRTYVRNWISEKYMAMIEADWAQASDRDHPAKLEHQDRVDRFLRSMAKLHGADAPVQQEVKVEAAPEAVEKMVSILAAGQGLNYDDTVFDIVDAEVIEETTAVIPRAAAQSAKALEVSGNAVGKPQPGDGEGL